MTKIQVSNKLYTSTIGSFPLEHTLKNMERCLEDLLETGIDIPNYPQLKHMLYQFSSDSYVEPLRITLDYLNRDNRRERIVGVKACTVGPVTMAYHITHQVFPDINTIRQETGRIVEFCSSFIKEGADVITIDDPQLSIIVGKDIRFSDGNRTITGKDEDLIEIYNSILKLFPDALVGLHVCGTISPKLADILTKTKFDYLSHEFSQKPSNFGVYDCSVLENTKKLMMVGVVSSSDPNVEEITTIEGRIKEAGEHFGYENLMISSDCGFKPLVIDGSSEKGYLVAMEKLGRMCKAVKNVRQSIGY